MVDQLAISKPEWRKDLVEAKQIAVQNVEKHPQLEEEEKSPPPVRRKGKAAAIEYKPPTPSPTPSPSPPPAMRPAKPRNLPQEEKISLSSVGSEFLAKKAQKSFCKNVQEESDSE